MEIIGKLKQDIIDGRVVLFLGAGASMTAGLFGAQQLAEYLFNAASSLGASLSEYEDRKNDLAFLVARLDENPFFSREQWVNDQLIKYFLNRKNYSNLELHKILLQLPLQAIFTTNYDYCLEFASGEIGQMEKLMPIWDGSQRAEIFRPPEGCLPYYKIHGCCAALRAHPKTAPRLVITRNDFRESASAKQYFYERLGDLARVHSVVFIGFHAEYAESDQMMSYILDAYKTSRDRGHSDFRPFAVLPSLTGTRIHDLKDAGLTPLVGTFEDFINAANEIVLSSKSSDSVRTASIEQNVAFTVQGRAFYVNRWILERDSTQFLCLHDNLREELRNELKNVSSIQIEEMWKSEPNDSLLFAGGYYIERDLFTTYVNALKIARDRIIRDKAASQILWLEGKYGSGKSVVAHQLAWYAYYTLGLPTIQLVKDATYTIKTDTGKTVEISGWDEKRIDKFLSLAVSHAENNSEEDDSRIVPVIIADHVVHRANALEHLLHYLEEHKKPCILILTISDEELAVAKQESLLWGPSLDITRLKRMYSGLENKVQHKLSDYEIEHLFNVVAQVNSRIADKRIQLVSIAKDEDYCDRDFLLILYTWFDRRFRRFEEIIAEEAGILENNDELKQLYLATAVFHRYHLRPRLGLCTTGIGMSNDSYALLQENPLFKTLINVHQSWQDVGTTRHAEFSRRIVEQLLPTTAAQVDFITKILTHCTDIDTEFVRSLMNHLYHVELSLSYDQIIKLKEATEEGLKNDYVLNHQFAAYLIRNNIDLVRARYYLDTASSEYPDNGSIIHSFGNLCYRKYCELLLDPSSEAQREAHKYFRWAREYLAKSRTLHFGEEEHGYYTEISMLKHRLDHEADLPEVRATIDSDRHALLFEALRVVPPDRQHFLKELLGNEIQFHRLPSQEQELLKNQILSGEASYLLLRYYGDSLLDRRKAKTWKLLRTLIDTYWDKASSDFSTAVTICLLAKRGFIKNAETRLKLLKPYYDKIRYAEKAEVNFILLAEYVRLLMVDAFALGQFQFLYDSAADVAALYTRKKPRFLGDEYILTNEFYRFDENDTEQNIYYFEQYPNSVWSNSRHAARFQRIAYIPPGDRYVKIQLDNITQYYIRVPRQEIVTHTSYGQLDFAVKYSPEGFFAVDVR